MTKGEKLSKKYNSLLYNHIWLKYVHDYGKALFFTIFSAFIYAVGFNCFVRPDELGGAASELLQIISGGSSGLAQVLERFLFLFGIKGSFIWGLFYVLINVPIIILAFRSVGKRFGVFTLVNVALVYIFTTFVVKGQIFIDLAIAVNEHTSLLGRALFAGLTTGLSSAAAFKVDSSAGGFDVVSYYFANKKGTATGKYVVIINASIFTSFTLLNIISLKEWVYPIMGLLISVVYIFTVSLLVDLINIRNKKTQIQIITNKQDLPELLLSHIPHGATLVNGKGVYSGQERYIVYMVVSTGEVKQVLKIIKELDPDSFVNVYALMQVYGKFYTKPIK